MELITNQDIIAGYLTDASNTHGHADALLRPRDTQEVVAIVRMAQKYNIPITVTAQRTSTTGGPVPNGGWLLSTERLNTIHSDTHVDGGVILGEYQRYLERKGLLFPPDPTSRNECSIGACVACNASGARSFRYGATRLWIERLEVVTPNGEVQIVDRNTRIPEHWPDIYWREPNVKTSAGYSPTNNLLDLMIGQEGTLGIITKVWTKLITLPNEVLGMIVYFFHLEDCVSCVEELRIGAVRPNQEGNIDALSPRAIEFFDARSISLMRARVEVPEKATCGLFLEVEHDGDLDLDPWFDIFERHHALCDDIIAAENDEERERLYRVRHAIPAGVNEQIIANGMPKVGTDFSVPDSGLRAMMEVYDDVSMPSVLFGHIGDNHLHLNLLPRNSSELEDAKALYVQLAHKAVSLGGSVSAEHGIGKIKKGLLAHMVGQDVVHSFQALKSVVDPNWILGRGVLFEKK